MKKNDIKMNMQQGFLELSPNVFETVREAVEQENQMLQEIKTEKSEKFSQNENSAVRSPFLRRFSKYAISACISMALLCICLFGIFGKNQNDIYLVLDINPSIQIVTDDSFRVKRLQGLNQDGKEVVEKLEWNQKESLFDTLGRMLDSVVEEDYLKEDGGILVTICLSDHEMYENLENKMGESIDSKLKEMGVSGIITAFQQGKEGYEDSGRKQLEEELVKEYGVDVQQVQQMSVVDLIYSSRECEASGLSFSAESEKQWEESSEQEKEQNEEKASSGKEDVKQESESRQSNTQEKEESTDETKKESEESTEPNRDKEISEFAGQPQEDVNTSASLETSDWIEFESTPSQNETQPQTSSNGPEEDKDKDKSSEGKDKESKDKDKNENGNNKDKEKNENNKDKNKNGNNKDKEKNGNNKDKNKNGNNKDKNKNGNNKDKGSNKDRDKNSKDKDENGSSNKEESGNNEAREKNGSNEGKDSKDKGGNSDSVKGSVK